jgi:hypothetical protein
MTKGNPFTINPIKEKKEFIGRKNLIDQVADMLFTQQCCHIVGERKSGKTSFLYRIAEEFKGRDFEFVFLDMQQLKRCGPEEIFGRIAHSIDASLPEKEMNHNEFEDFINGRKVIVAFDEMSAIMGSKKLNNDFFEFLRAILTNFDIVYLTTHTEELYETTKGVSSPFFNYFRNFYLGYFTNKESEELIQKGGRDFFSNYGEWILEKAYYHPFLLQLSCLILFEHHKENKEDKESMFLATEKEAFETLEGHFKYWYNKSSEEEKRVLESISREENISTGDESVVSKLERRLLVYNKNGRSHLVSPFLEKVMEEKTKNKMGEELEEKTKKIEEEFEEKKKKIEQEFEETPLSRYYLIILCFLVGGLVVSIKIKDAIFQLFYISFIIMISVALIYRRIGKVIQWNLRKE